MTLMHWLNLTVHVMVGIVAIGLGFHVIQTPHEKHEHRSRGRKYVALTLVVCLTAAIGIAVFRFMPLFAVLTVLVSYQVLSGCHVIYTGSAGPNAIDALLLLGGAALGATLAMHLLSAEVMVQAPASVVISTLGAIAVLLIYDALRWLFPKRWHAALWRYEHIYKIVGSLFAMISAAVGNTIRVGQPWSQLMPSGVGLAVIVWYSIRNYRAQRSATTFTPVLGAVGELHMAAIGGKATADGL